MKESGYYPPGAEFDPRAPYNEKELPEQEFDIYSSQSLSKSFRVRTNKYVPEEDRLDTSDTCWSEVFDENEHLTPFELLAEFKGLIKETIMSYEKDLMSILADPKRTNEVANRIKRLSYLERECDGWVIDEEEFGEE